MLRFNLKRKIDDAIIQYHIQPVGCGYIDCICSIENVEGFIDCMIRLGVQITMFSWWCHVTENHKPCGMGGPVDSYGDGWYSEIEMGKTYEFSSNQQMRDYLLFTWKSEKLYKPCYVPAFFLNVPKRWKNIYYKENNL